LGKVGGRIVGEVLVGLLDHDPSSFRVAAGMASRIAVPRGGEVYDG
jgi:hypothetical protein